MWATVAIFAALATDQAAKHTLLSVAMGLNGKNLIPGLLDVRFTWNRGVSFSLFWPSSALGSLLLFAVASCIVAALIVWTLRTHRVLVAVATGLIIGGALGNLADRYVYGAVFDFLVVRIGDARLFVCNLADIAITLGVAGVLIDALQNRSAGVTTD
jgi:signal peptidase II